MLRALRSHKFHISRVEGVGNRICHRVVGADGSNVILASAGKRFLGIPAFIR